MFLGLKPLMNFIARITLVTLAGTICLRCDSTNPRFKNGNCLQPSSSNALFTKGTYKVTSVSNDNLDASLLNLENGSEKQVSKLDRGWRLVPCPSP